MLETLMDAPWWVSAILIAAMSFIPLCIAGIMWETTGDDVFEKLVNIVIGIGIFFLAIKILNNLERSFGIYN